MTIQTNDRSIQKIPKIVLENQLRVYKAKRTRKNTISNYHFTDVFFVPLSFRSIDAWRRRHANFELGTKIHEMCKRNVFRYQNGQIVRHRSDLKTPAH